MNSIAIEAAVRSATQGLHDHARIAPQALIQLARAIDDRFGRTITARLFFAAGLTTRLSHLPEVSVPVQELARLYAVMEQGWGLAVASDVAAEAGSLLADHLIAHAIPATLLHHQRHLPVEFAARQLVYWLHQQGPEVVGVGIERWRTGPGSIDLHLSKPLEGAVSRAARRALLARLFVRLVHPDAQVSPEGCFEDCHYRIDLVDDQVRA